MSEFSISNLAHQLGSNKILVRNFGKKFPHWNIQKVITKTGIKNIFLSNKNEDVLSLSIKSCKKTLNDFDKKKIDCVIVVTQTAKKKLPSISCMLQNKLNLNKNVIAFDIGLGCSGFVYGLSIISSLINSDMVKSALLVCSDTYSAFINDQNRTCKTIFSDAASSCIVSKVNSKKNVQFTFLTDGSGANDLIENNMNIEMNGPNVFHFTTKNVPKIFNNILRKNSLDKKDISHFIFHQASKLVINEITKVLEIKKDKVFKNYEKIGNTVSSSIPIALESLNNQGKLKKKQKILLVGFGVGLSASAAIINWA